MKIEGKRNKEMQGSVMEKMKKATNDGTEA